MPNPSIFISYRRADSAETVNRLYDRLVYTFNHIFKDVDSIQRGDDFPEVIREAVESSSIMLVVIGQKWLTVQDTNRRRRIDAEKDWVRYEIELGLARPAKEYRVIPVVVDGATLPGGDALPESIRPLATRDGTTLRVNPHFHDDVSALIISVQRLLGQSSVAEAGIDAERALDDLNERLDAEDWDTARQIIARLRAAPNLPKWWPLDDIEGRIFESVQLQERNRDYAHLRKMLRWLPPARAQAAVAELAQVYNGYVPDDLERFKPHEPIPPKANTQTDPSSGVVTRGIYNPLLELMPKIEFPPLLSDEQIKELTQLPLADLLNPSNRNASVEAAVKLPISYDSVQEAIIRAGSFTGKRNADWIPFVTTFLDLKIPDMRFCLVPVGTFLMGGGTYNEEKPIHP